MKNKRQKKMYSKNWMVRNYCQINHVFWGGGGGRGGLCHFKPVSVNLHQPWIQMYFYVSQELDMAYYDSKAELDYVSFIKIYFFLLFLFLSMLYLLKWSWEQVKKF